MANRFLKYSDKQLEDLINNVYGGEITRKNLPVDLYEATVEKLTDGIFEGFGKSFGDKLNATDASYLINYTHNASVFSAAKTFQQVNDMSNALLDGDGNKRPFSDFKKDADVIFDEYNENWLKAEYNTAISQAQAGAQWSQVQANKEVLPLLRYSTVGDGRVRDEHAEWEGVTLPVDHPWWDTHFPPNDFNCRCSAEQLEEGEITELGEGQLNDPDDLFAMNAGRDKVVFKEDEHPYFKVADKYEVLKDDNFGLPTLPEPPRKS